ncbi:aminotransferase [Paenibacillus sp. 2RAB27]|uniref:aminotransferase n=1 Tax=Paenibacillus sp. 2RAB27 TaxID=3232991 RepID=UPI003F9D94E6
MSNPRQQIIGNGGNRPEVETRSLTLPGEGFGQYPGLGSGNPFGGGGFEGGGGFFGGPPAGGNAGGGFFGGGGGGNAGGGLFGGGGGNTGGGGGGGNFLSNLLGGGGGSAGGSSNPLSGLNIKQISGFVERMGGIDGIIGTMGKVQKFMSTFQQMAPMVKTLLGSIGKGKVASDEVTEVFRPKRKRRKKSGTGKRRKGRSTSGTAKRKRR